MKNLVKDFVPFYLISSTQLIIDYCKSIKLRRITKPLLIPVLSYVYHYICFSKKIQENKTYYIIYFFHWMGDIFLLFGDWSDLYKVGIVSFFIGDSLLAKEFYKMIPNFQLMEYLCIYVFYFPIVLFILFVWYIKYSKIKTIIAAFIYDFPLTSMLALSTYLFIKTSKDIDFILMFGCISFFISDHMIIHELIVPTMYRRHFWVMLTYLIAEGLICYSNLCH